LSHHSDLIDTTEMYLRTVYELEEEGIVPLRARIAERLRQSGPTVSQTVARMERDSLLTVEGDRHLQLTETGRRLAVAVMRKHRLAECLLVDVIGLPWEDVHIEACRWEHVMSEAVERRIFELLAAPTTCPHGNPIPGLDELGAVSVAADLPGLTTMKAAAAGQSAADVVVRRISEQLQPDAGIMRRLREAGVQPGRSISVEPSGEGVFVHSAGRSTDVEELVASHVFVTPA
jgi:DtxR family Mn-dependent transcriptional regulator